MNLLQAVYTGRADEVAAIRSQPGRTLTLAEAAAVGDVREVAARLRDGVGADEPSPDGFTPLQLACHFDHAGAAALLVRAGASLEQRSAGSMTVQALHAAAASPTGACIPLLLAAGAPVDGTQGGGFTALHEAAMRSNRSLVDLLLAAGADPTLTADDGRSAAAMAEAAGAPDLAAHLHQDEANAGSTS
jgi:ankyrin repeat protein